MRADPRLTLMFLLSLRGTCGESTQRPACLSLDAVEHEARDGSLRSALESIERHGDEAFCDAAGARRLRAQVLVELGRADGEARPRSADELALAKRAHETAHRKGKQASAEEWLAVWSAAPPNGLALVRAGLATRPLTQHRFERSPRSPEVEARERAARRLFERGVAELERETGVLAHAGMRAPPVCQGHFDNHLTVRWLDDSLHVVVSCLDGTMIVDAVTGSRVAQYEGSRDDPEAKGAVSVQDDDIVWTEHSVIRRVRVAWPPTRDDARARLTRDGRTLVVIVESDIPLQGTVLLIDSASGRERARLPGYDIRELDDGTIAVRTPSGVQRLDRGLRKAAFLPGDLADLSPDGETLAYGKVEGESEMYHPHFPYMRSLRVGNELRLGDLEYQPSMHSASISWPRLARLQATSCAPLGTMPSGHDVCVHPAVTIGGREYGSNDEVACATLTEGTQEVACLDPRGPVDASDPWDYGLVCRVGRHVLPLGVCAHLLAH